MRVLLVEDSARLRKSVGAALKKSGYAVDTAADGEDGLWFAQSYEPPPPGLNCVSKHGTF